MTVVTTWISFMIGGLIAQYFGFGLGGSDMVLVGFFTAMFGLTLKLNGSLK